MGLLGHETLTLIKSEGHYYSYLKLEVLICEQKVIFQTHSEAELSNWVFPSTAIWH